jgi:hypothetical protein
VPVPARHCRLESIQSFQDRERFLGWRAAVDGGLEQATRLVRLAALEGRERRSEAVPSDSR